MTVISQQRHNEVPPISLFTATLNVFFHNVKTIEIISNVQCGTVQQQFIVSLSTKSEIYA